MISGLLLATEPVVPAPADVVGAWITLCVVIAIFTVVITAAFILTLRDMPRIVAWTERPMGRMPTVIKHKGSKYICLPIEAGEVSWPRVQDVLAAAEQLRADRAAKKRTELPG